jgi:hypothetical protein
MDSQVTRSRQRILESAVVLLREGNLPGQLVEGAAAAARVPLGNAKTQLIQGVSMAPIWPCC